MDQALYRKYRSRSFDEVVGQEHVTKTLKQAIKNGRISHAYLFTGPRGVGKTSVARILAHEVNGLLYDDESVHLDIIEIDAASNRRIDEIRDLRDRVKIAPISAKYKVYIIDEVHMLTREAFNALLKTLEEPPAHCIFILATTEGHKLPETIVSRTQRFEFKPVGSNQSAEHLRTIAKSEKLKITDGALLLLADFGNGSFRDSISYLDQLSSMDKEITEDDVREVLGLPSAHEISLLLRSLELGDSQKMMSVLADTRDRGISSSILASSLSKELRKKLIDDSGSPVIHHLLRQLIDVPASNNPSDYLEIAMLEACASSKPEPGVKPSETKTLEDTVKKPRIAAASVPAFVNASEIVQKSHRNTSGFQLEDWDKVLEAAKKQNSSIYTALRLAKPSLVGNQLTLTFQFPLHKKKLEQSDNKNAVVRIIEEQTKSVVQLSCLVDKEAFNKLAKYQPSNETVSPISNVFGAAEVLESTYNG